MSHTPGPWNVGVYETTENFRKIHQHACVCKPDTMLLIATCGPAEDEQSQHDADLIATAPDLLEALKDFLSASQDDLNGIGQTGRDLWENARAAIAKAEGK